MRLVFFLIFITTIGISAQENKKGIVNYGHKRSFGMGGPIGIDFNAQLIFSSNESTYTFKKDSLEGGAIDEVEERKNNKGEYFLIQKKTRKKGLFYNINRTTNLIKSYDVGFVFVKDSIPAIKWNILSETKKIGNISCQKATCNFRGRDYTAWFAPELPVPFGPWKLQGLPGLILEAYDTKKEIYFYFKSIEYPSSKRLKINVPRPSISKNETWINFEAYKKSLIKRNLEGLKRGRMLFEQFDKIESIENDKSMKRGYIEVFN